ncbi:MAG TPA: hypothetical protein VLL74_01065 [Methanoregula sp.]|nr:hypothetical protein [Methanoregula sp.]
MVMLALALVLLLDFVKRYRETKAWLDDIADKEKHNQENES